MKNNWQIKTFDEIFTISAGGDIDKKSLSFEKNEKYCYPVYANAIANQGLYGYSDKYKIDKESLTITARGDIGKIFYRQPNYTPIVRLIVCLPKDNINIKFMSYACSKIKFINETTGVSQLTVPNVKKYKISVPPLAEQEKIVLILSKQDEVIEKLEKLIELKIKQKKGLMQRFIYTQKGTKSYKVKDLFELGRGRVISKNEIEKNKGIYPVYSSQTLDDGILGYINTYDFECKCITWTTDGANAGDVFYRNGRFNCTNVCGIAKAKDESMINLYYATCFLNHVTKKYVSYVGNPKLMNGVFAVIPLELPEINIQNKVASILSKSDEEIELLKKKLELCKKQKKWLMQKLLSGEIRVDV